MTPIPMEHVLLHELTHQVHGVLTADQAREIGHQGHAVFRRLGG